MNDKLNNYHFGRHVFEYFPWYTYPNDLKYIPILDDTIRSRFQFAFKDYNPVYTWYRELDEYKDEDEYILYSPQETFIYSNSTLRYKGITEDVNDWEDIEKIRLRIILGTKKGADEYFKIIEFYNTHFNDISDMVYTQAGEDIEIPIYNICDLINRKSKNICLKFI